MRNNILLTVLAVFIVLNTAHANDTLEHKLPTEMPLKEAFEKGLVKVNIRGAYDPSLFNEVLNSGDGEHYGKCMAIFLESNVNGTLLLKLNSGTFLMPKDDQVQRMIVTNDVVFPLNHKQQYWTRFYAMCTQFENQGPLTYHTFKIGEMADSNLVRLSKYLEQSYNQNIIGQCAVWAYTDKVSFEKLKEHGYEDSNSLKKTIEILNAAKVVTPLNSIANKAEIMPNTIPTMTLNSYEVYAGIGLIGLLSITTIAALIRRRRKSVA